MKPVAIGNPVTRDDNGIELADVDVDPFRFDSTSTDFSLQDLLGLDEPLGTIHDSFSTGKSLEEGHALLGFFFPTRLYHALPAALAGAMNFSVDPCEDFYRYACGGWVEVNPFQGDRANIDQFSIVRDRITHQLRDVVDGIKSSTVAHNKWTTKLLLVHDACTQEKRAHDIPAAATAGNTTVAVRVAEYNDIGIFPYFRLAVKPNPTEGINTLMWTSRGNPALVKDDHAVAIYRKHIENLLTLANETVPASTMDAIMEIERQLAAPAPVGKNVTRSWNPVSWEEFQRLTPNFSWTEYWTAYGEPDFASKFKIVSYDSLDSLQFVDSLFKDRDPAVLAQYERVMELKSVAHLIAPLHKERERYYLQQQGTTKLLPLWKRCLWYAEEQFGWVMSRKYLQKYPVAKEQSTKLVNAIKDSLTAPDWMDAKTKALAKEKKEAIIVNIGSPDWMDDDKAFDAKLELYYGNEDLGEDLASIQKGVARASKAYALSIIGKREDRKWGLDSRLPTDVNAYYSRSKNSLNFPSGILRAPFMDSDNINAMNWGSLGMIIGQELFHAFDDQGARFDKDGRLNQWWEPALHDNYLEKQQCITKQYDALGANGARTLSATMADNAGFSLSRQSFLSNTQDWMGVHDGKHLCEHKVFFIAFAQTWCAHSTEEYQKWVLDSTERLTGDIRVNGVIMNSKEFGDLFNCPVGSPMNPEKKCTVI
eukprot:GEMP01019281.1.p1 GENE.GEMP01019281.1~~GEMP01019281.1.p1  ORF type:complete len:706 (+),score=155.78 GEMP01019281.1:18-2135(+)